MLSSFSWVLFIDINISQPFHLLQFYAAVGDSRFILPLTKYCPACSCIVSVTYSSDNRFSTSWGGKRLIAASKHHCLSEISLYNHLIEC